LKHVKSTFEEHKNWSEKDKPIKNQNGDPHKHFMSLSFKALRTHQFNAFWVN
jgi:hypothetical protein